MKNEFFKCRLCGSVGNVDWGEESVCGGCREMAGFKKVADKKCLVALGCSAKVNSRKRK